MAAWIKNEPPAGRGHMPENDFALIVDDTDAHTGGIPKISYPASLF
jgi:phosphatidylethanolamine-binding protein (PEBP) family uncharacterized protein